MEIKITWGTGTGQTELSAFDAALYQAGIANYNLIKLSSIIPPGSSIKKEQLNLNDDAFGHKLYLVYSHQTVSETGRQAWAGLGWVQTQDQSGKGLFVEHDGSSEEEVIALITESLNDMLARRKENYGPIQYQTAGAKCESQPVCALVAAIYKSENWG